VSALNASGTSQGPREDWTEILASRLASQVEKDVLRLVDPIATDVHALRALIHRQSERIAELETRVAAQERRQPENRA